MSRQSFRKYESFSRLQLLIVSTFCAVFTWSSPVLALEGTCNDNKEFRYALRNWCMGDSPCIETGVYVANIWIYTVKSADKINFESSLQSILKKNPWSTRPYANCHFTKEPYTGGNTDILSKLDCVNQQGIRSSEYTYTSNLHTSYINIPTGNGKTVSLDRETPFAKPRVMCNTRRVRVYHMGKIKVGDQIVKDKIYFYTVEYTPDYIDIQRRPDTVKDIQF